MSDGKWSGGTANRNWARPGSRTRVTGDAARGLRLFEELKGERFLCECGRLHPLIEHRQCRDLEAARPNPGR